MYQVKKVKQQAIDIKKILKTFLKDFTQEEELAFRACFHLRPTSSNDTTIVSTMAIAPMRGKPNVSPEELESKLQDIRKVMDEPSNDKKLNIMREIGFDQRKSKAIREEDAQAALIRDLVLYPEKIRNMQFIASEFDLFEFGPSKDQTKRPDVLAFKDGILYDIELKNERIAPGGSKESAIEQAAEYVKHIKDNLSEYKDCLAEFPNFKIEEIRNVRGIALFPYSERSSGKLEKAGEKYGVELWFFTENLKFII
ncbi:MAG: hypothetical protein FWG71_04160 [Synergistaceae bacterium]|nr:hypothetical protein [Synergistaceae bacterium]